MAAEESMGGRMELEEKRLVRGMKDGWVNERKRREDKLIEVLH